MDRAVDVLLVEDEPVDAMTFERAVRRHGLLVDLEIAETAEAALGVLVDRSRVQSVHVGLPDVIIADLRLPQRSGLDLLEQVKAVKALRSIPFVVLSTSTHESDVATAYARGAAGYFVKTVVFDDFARTIESILRFIAHAVRPPPDGPA